jgi:glycerol-3-phosphate acyltransferase PlsX
MAMKIALDAMGGDKAPVAIVDGAIEATQQAAGRFELLLVGQADELKNYISGSGLSTEYIEIVDAPEVIGMSESPATAIRRKRNSSIAVACRLQKEGRADALVSAGNTGAAVASSLLSLGRIPGIDRPAIAIFYPSRNGGTIVLDGGANSDNVPRHLEQFAVMGSAYAELFLGRKNPKIGLLNIGEESSKGSELTREAHELLSSSGLNFTGNVEGRDVIAGTVDVVVTDGFTGNVLLKFTESIVHFLGSLMKEGIEKSFRAKIGAGFMKPVFMEMRKTLDYAEYGGMPLLGIDGVTIIGHGGSSAKAIKNAVLAAERFVELGINSSIKEKIRNRSDKNV